MSSCIVNIGLPFNGKTFRTMMLVERHKKKSIVNAFGDAYKFYAVDPKNQYKDYKEVLQVNPFEDIRKPLQEIYDARFFVDEAQIYFPLGHSNQELTRALGICGHNRTMTVLNFHAIQQVPIYIRNYCNEIWLGHTNDDISYASNFGPKTEKVKNAMLALREYEKERPNACIRIE